MNRLYKRLTGMNRLKSVWMIYGLAAVIFSIMAVISPSYRSVNNIGNVIVQCIPLAILSLGQTFVMIGGGIDMSIGSTVSMTTCIAATTMTANSPLNICGGILLAFAAAVLIGLANGAGVNYFKVPPMITTLSTMTILSGISLKILPMAGGKVDKGFANVIMARLGVLSVPLLILLLVFLLLRVLLYKTRTGIHIYAIGNSRDISSSMGVRSNRTSILTYIIAGCCAVVTGILLASRMRIGDPVIGSPMGLDSITAAAIGGTALSGGQGFLSGTIAGALLIGMLSNMMNVLGINHFYQYVLKGLLLVLAMIFYSLSQYVGVKRRG